MSSIRKVTNLNSAGKINISDTSHTYSWEERGGKILHISLKNISEASWHFSFFLISPAPFTIVNAFAISLIPTHIMQWLPMC